MSVKNTKKIGFWVAILFLIGSVVGIGIFFKNHSVIRASEQNGITTLISWILGGLLSLAAAISFSEIGSLKTQNVHGLPGYAEKTGGRYFGYFVRFNYTFFYFGLLTIVLSFFCSEILIGMFVSWGNKAVSDVPIYGHAIIALGIASFLITLNWFSLRKGALISSIATILKWIPLVLVIFVGLIQFNTNNYSSPDSTYGRNLFSHPGHPFKFESLLAALPAVLFAYDAFLTVTSLSNKIEGGEKTVSKVVILGMVSVVVLYTLIAVSSIVHGAGFISSAPFGKGAEALGIFEQALPKNVSSWFGKVVIVFLAISTFGITNAITTVNVQMFEQSLTSETIIGSRFLKRKFGSKVGSLVLLAIISIFWALVIYIPAIALNTDSFVDGASNFPTLFFFAIYALVILFYTLKRKNYGTLKINRIIFLVASWVAIIGIGFVFLYQLVWGFTGQAILHPNNSTHWGLYLGDSDPTYPAITLKQGAIILWAFFAIFLIAPILNWYLIKKIEKREVAVNTQLGNSIEEVTTTLNVETSQQEVLTNTQSIN